MKTDINIPQSRSITLIEKNITYILKKIDKVNWNDKMNKTSQWNSIFTFIMAMIGLTIGIGNIWRFSYVLYSNGGGSFFIPYIIAILVMGIPFLILEYGLGFSFKKSFSYLMHSIRPEFEIIALMLVLFVFIVVIYYMIILGWDFAYFLNSFNFGWEMTHRPFLQVM